MRVDLPVPWRSGDRSEQDPEQWWNAVSCALRTLHETLDPAPVAALAVDGTSASVLAVDARGTPLGPALMYDDSRAREEAQRIAAVAPPASAARGPTSSLAKLLYLRERYGDARIGGVLHQADWIAARLSGRMDVSDENNCLKLGYDPSARCWPPWLDVLGLPGRLLPVVLEPGTPLGTLTETARVEAGIDHGAIIVAGTTDSTAACIATGIDRVGEAVTTLGSTLVLKVLTQRQIADAALGVYSHRLGDRWLAGGASNTGGAVLRRYFAQQDLDRLTPLLQPEHPTELDYYPLLAPGERFPVCDPGLQPRLVPRPPDDVRFLQGMLEGIAHIERDGYRALQRLGAPYPTAVVTAGGGARNQAWSTIRSGLLGVPVTAAHHQEAAYGAALLARHGATAKHSQ